MMAVAMVLDRELTLRGVLGEEWSEEVFASIGEHVERWLEDVEDMKFHEIDVELEAEVYCVVDACRTYSAHWNGGDGWITPSEYEVEDEEIEIESVYIRTDDGLEYSLNREELDMVTREANMRL